MKKGFTLIELLIVVLIIAILAAIAVPNFLEFQTRAKVSRAKTDMRSLSTAIEAYYVDNNEYPSMTNGADGANSVISGPNTPYPNGGAQSMCTFRLRQDTALSTLSTPIAYITSYFPDPFAVSKGATFGYRQFKFTWILISYGPDRDENEGDIPSDHTNVVCFTDINQNLEDQNFETPFSLGQAQPTPTYMTSVSVSAGSDDGNNALIYDPTNGTTSEGDVVRVKQ